MHSTNNVAPIHGKAIERPGSDKIVHKIFAGNDESWNDLSAFTPRANTDKLTHAETVQLLRMGITSGFLVNKLGPCWNCIVIAVDSKQFFYWTQHELLVIVAKAHQTHSSKQIAMTVIATQEHQPSTPIEKLQGKNDLWLWLWPTCSSQNPSFVGDKTPTFRAQMLHCQPTSVRLVEVMAQHW